MTNHYYINTKTSHYITLRITISDGESYKINSELNLLYRFKRCSLLAYLIHGIKGKIVGRINGNKTT